MQSLEDKSITDLGVSFNAHGWGPSVGERPTLFGSMGYQHFDKKEKIFRPADFTQSAFNDRRPLKPRRHFGDEHGEFASRPAAAEDGNFVMVDSASKPNKGKIS